MAEPVGQAERGPAAITAATFEPFRSTQTTGCGRADDYRAAVLAGTVPACWQIRAAVERAEKDRTRAVQGWRYVFVPERAERAVRFIEALPHVKGKWAAGRNFRPGTNLLRLEPWQAFAVAELFGWVDRDTGARRFNRAFWLIARKNAKSTLAAAIGAYMAFADGEQGAEVYSAATSLDQAMEVFTPARLMLDRTPRIVRHWQLSVLTKSVSRPADNSTFRPVKGRPRDGASPHCGIVDEYHEHPDEAVLESLLTGMGARVQPILLIISTAGASTSSPCYREQQAAERMLRGQVDDETLFALVFTVDDPDTEWCTVEGLAKANPNLGVSVGVDWLLDQVRQAEHNPARRGSVKTKHANIWSNDAVAFFDADRFAALADDSLTWERLAAVPCIIAVDAAWVEDLTSVVYLFDLGDRWAIKSRHYVTERQLEQRSATQYRAWAETGEIEVVRGPINDQTALKAQLLADQQDLDVIEVAIDPYKMRGFMLDLQAEGVEVIEFGKQVKTFSEPMKLLRRRMIDGTISHDGNRCLEWMISNVRAYEDKKDNVLAQKARREDKIDGADALIMCAGRKMFAEPAPARFVSVYERRRQALSGQGIAQQ